MLNKAKAKTKTSTGAGAAGGAKDLSQSVRDSSRQIWLAGMGAFSKAQAEGMKVFDTLVHQGEALETRTRRVASGTADAAMAKAREVQAKAKEVQAMAGGTWDKLEQVFEERVARALSRLGVHTHNDVQRLAERVDALSDAVNQLIKARNAVPKPKARRAAGKPVPVAARAAKGKVARAGKAAKRVAK
jgi:poly(hydroxyalkanoate) granule-associated protein